MSKATKRKHATKEVLDEFVVPDDTHHIVKVNIVCNWKSTVARCSVENYIFRPCGRIVVTVKGYFPSMQVDGK